MTVSVDPRRRARIAETIGVLIIALVILAIALARWGRTVDWHVR